MSLFSLARTFRHGVHPSENKDSTESLAVERMPFTTRYILPLGQHIGAPARPVVRAGQTVSRGQVIAEPGGFVSTTHHAPVTGKVSAIGARHHPNGKLVESIEIEADPYSSQAVEASPPKDWTKLSIDEFVDEVQRAGIVGMGGAAFPAHVKYKPTEGKRLTRLIVNGAECEPYLTTDHRLMAEQPGAVIRGTEILAARLGVEETVIGVELNKPDAIAALRGALGSRSDIRVEGLRVKYPQGAEKMLITTLYGVEVPSGKLPLDVGILVNNVGTMVAISDWFDRGIPFIERGVTVAGPGARRPANLMVPVGTPVREVLNHAGGLHTETEELVMGGPMMGMPLASLDVPVLKGTSGLLAFTAREARIPTEYACIRCGRCLDACPHYLNPSLMGRLAKVGRHEDMEELNVFDCVECGACSFACPSGIPLVQLFRVAKSALRERKAKAS